MATMQIIDVYGDSYIIDADWYARGRVQIPLYTKNGKRRLSDYYESMGWKNRCTTIHRDNIASVVQR
jgi:hypothetical protein